MRYLKTFSPSQSLFCPSRRTASPNGSDWESEAYGLIATIKTKSCFTITHGYFLISVPYSTIRMPYFSISVPYSRQKKSFFCVLPSLPPFFARNPFIYWRSQTWGKTNFPPVSLPSRVPHPPIGVLHPVWSKSPKMGGSELKKGRVRWGTIALPPVPQTPCTSTFEGGDGRKWG